MILFPFISLVGHEELSHLFPFHLSSNQLLLTPIPFCFIADRDLQRYLSLSLTVARTFFAYT